MAKLNIGGFTAELAYTFVVNQNSYLLIIFLFPGRFSCLKAIQIKGVRY